MTPGSSWFEGERSMMRRHAAIAAVAVAPLLFLGACGTGGSSGGSASNVDFTAKPSGTLNAWAFDNADDVGMARMAYVGQHLNGVTIKYDQTTFNAQKFTTRLASGDVPDVVQMSRQYVPTYAAQGLILPLDKCFAAHNVDPKRQYYPSVAADVTYQNQIWAVPQFFQPPAIILNKNVMNAAGVTDDQIDTSKPSVLLAAIAKMYQQSGGVPTRLGFDPQATGEPYLWILGLGGHLVDKTGKPTLNDPANVYPLQFLKQIADAQGGYAKLKSFTDSFDFFGADNQYVKNQVGAEIDAQYYPNVLGPFKNQISIEAVPFRDRHGDPVTVDDGGQAFVIPAKAKNPAAACAWALGVTSQADWMASAAARAQTLAKNGGINTGLLTGSPAVDNAIRQQYIKPTGNAGFDQTINTYYDVLGHGLSVGASPAGQEIQSALKNAVTAALLGQKSPSQALADAQQAAMQAYDNVTH